jgi:5'-nucleotidase
MTDRASSLHVLVTNDDGVDAPGLDALVRALGTDPRVRVTVVAPADNQTGASERITMTAFDVAPAATASGYPATAVHGSPSDAVLFALRQLLAADVPALVLAGINEGPNLADFVTMSGTVAAALAAARLGVPAVAGSLGLAPTMDYDAPARFLAAIAARFRDDAAFRARLWLPDPERTGVVLNVNFPSIAPRGVRVVPLGRLARVTGYVPQGDPGAAARWEPVLTVGDVSLVHPDSTLAAPTTDIEAFNHGFVAVTPLVPDLTLAAALAAFGDVER